MLLYTSFFLSESSFGLAIILPLWIFRSSHTLVFGAGSSIAITISLSFCIFRSSTYWFLISQDMAVIAKQKAIPCCRILDFKYISNLLCFQQYTERHPKAHGSLTVK
jgi:hypothetical protein